jgi:hypothetical protein
VDIERGTEYTKFDGTLQLNPLENFPGAPVLLRSLPRSQKLRSSLLKVQTIDLL